MMKRFDFWAVGASLLIICICLPFTLWLVHLEWHLPLMPLGVRASPGPSVFCMVPATYRTGVGGAIQREEVSTLGKYVSGYLTRINVMVQPESVTFALRTTDGWEVNTLMIENVHSSQRMDRTRPIMIIATYNEQVALPRKQIVAEIVRPVYALGARIKESHRIGPEPLSGDLARVEILPRERETWVVKVFTTAGESWNVEVPGPTVEIVIHENP